MLPKKKVKKTVIHKLKQTNLDYKNAILVKQKCLKKTKVKRFKDSEIGLALSLYHFYANFIYH